MRRAIGLGACVVLAGVVGCAAETSDPAATDTAGGAGATATTIGGDPSAGAGASVADFCSVSRVSEQKCQGCHGTVRAAGAPMSLVTHADFHAQAWSDPTRKVYELIPARINATDNSIMPPVTLPQLAALERDQLNAWVQAGAPAPAAGCETVPIDSGATATAGTGAIENPNPIPAEGPVVPDPSLEEDVVCYETFRAHASGSMDEPYFVGTATDRYMQFEFNSPWQGSQWIRSVRSKLDNLPVVHHWLLYKLGAATVDGRVGPSPGAHPGAELVHGWAPGAEDLVLPEDVAMEAPSTGWLLEFHYNSTDPTALDASAVEMCVAQNARTHNASISWLGTNAISGTSATGNCDPRDDLGDITVLGWTPHMHETGLRMTAVINRAGAAPEPMHDAPFDFYYQIAYEPDAPVIIKPGDTITTTCTYGAPATFGEGTGDEMCYFFTLYYPRLALTDGKIFGGIQSANTCLGGLF